MSGFFTAGGALPSAMLKKTVNQTALNATGGVVLSWDDEVYDIGALHDKVTNNSRIIAPLGANYMAFGASLGLSSVDLGVGYQLMIIKNGVVGTYDGIPRKAGNVPTATLSPYLNISGGPVPVVGGVDYFECWLQVLVDTSITVVALESHYWGYVVA